MVEPKHPSSELSTISWEKFTFPTTDIAELENRAKSDDDRAGKYDVELEGVCIAKGVEPRLAVLPDKVYDHPPKPGDQAMEFACNAFGILHKEDSGTPRPEIHVYEVCIAGLREAAMNKPINLSGSGRSRDDAAKYIQRQDCHIIFNAIANNSDFADFFGLGQRDIDQSLVYDLNDHLYSTRKLNFGVSTAGRQSLENRKNEGVMRFYHKIEPNDERFGRRFSYVILSVRNTFHKVIKDTDLKAAAGIVEKNLDHWVRQYFEASTSQYALSHPDKHIMFDTNTTYFVRPDEFGYDPQDLPPIDNSKYLGVGTKKTIRVAEGPNIRPGKHGGSSIFVEAKKTPFYNQIDALTFACASLGMTDRDFVQSIGRGLLPDTISRLSEAMSGLFIFSQFDKQYYRIRKVNAVLIKTARDVRFSVDDQEIDLVQYYQQKFGYQLKFPNAPVVEVHAGVMSSRSRYLLTYPIECLFIAENQRVKHQTPELIQKIIRACAVAPSRLYKQILDGKNAWNFGECKILAENDLKIEGRRMLPPTIVYKNDRESKPFADNCKWKTFPDQQFVIPVTIAVWAVYYLSDHQPQHNEMSLVDQFVQRYVEECKRRGIIVDLPSDVQPKRVHELESVFNVASQHEVEFILFVHDDNERAGHSAFKYLEQQIDIATQGVKLTTVRNIVSKGHRDTLSNIVMKTNMKLGGLNYSLRVSPGTAVDLNRHLTETLYIGFAVNQPAAAIGGSPKTSPDVIGYSANVGTMHPFEFIGDFAYAKSGGQNANKMEVVCKIIKSCVMRFRNISNRTTWPNELVIYRHSCDEKTYRAILKFEIPLIEQALKELPSAPRIHWAYIVPNKLHAARIFNKKVVDPDPEFVKLRPTEQNINPGTIVDKAIVHPCYNEFYLCSHQALQGTAKVPRYTILYNSNKDLTMDDLQRVTWNLSFGHQIVGLPVSLPAPCFIADRYASRGRMLYNEHVNVQENPAAEVQERMEAYTKKLCFASTKYLSDVRINA